MTRERPILFSGPMVRAILSGAKTQTRRVVKANWYALPPEHAEGATDAIQSGWATIWPGKHTHTWDADGIGGENWYHDDGKPNDLEFRKGEAAFYAFRQGFWRCPYGQVGDRLWVRETAYIAPPNFSDSRNFTHLDPAGRPRVAGYAASMDGESVRCARDYGIKKTPSIHMPRWASRITLEITGVRVERLQSTSGIDALAEGIESVYGNGASVTDFAHLWDGINSERGFGWDKNPWVWAIEFKRIPNSESA